MDKEKLVQALLLEIEAMQTKLVAMKQQLNLLEVTIQADAAALKANELRIKQLELLVQSQQAPIVPDQQQEAIQPAAQVAEPQIETVVEAVVVEAEKEVDAPEKVAPVEVEEVAQTASVRSEVKDARLVTDLRKAIGLNDRFRFKNDLFGNNERLLFDTIDVLNEMQSLSEADAYLKAHFEWKTDDATVTYFYEILERKYYRP